MSYKWRSGKQPINRENDVCMATYLNQNGDGNRNWRLPQGAIFAAGSPEQLDDRTWRMWAMTTSWGKSWKRSWSSLDIETWIAHGSKHTLQTDYTISSSNSAPQAQEHQYDRTAMYSQGAPSLSFSLLLGKIEMRKAKFTWAKYFELEQNNTGC